MKHPIITSLALAVLAGIFLVPPASATLVDYSITGATGNNWSGQFDVSNLAVVACDNGGNTLSISARDWLPINSSPPSNHMFYFGSGGTQLSWVYYDFLPDPDVVYGLTIDSAELSEAVQANGWSTTWNDLIGHSYAIDTGLDPDTERQLQVTFADPTHGSLTGTGGQISFSMSAVPELTSSFTLLGLMSSGLLLRRHTQRIRTLNIEH